MLEVAARQGSYEPLVYARLSVDPTGLSLPILMAGPTVRTRQRRQPRGVLVDRVVGLDGVRAEIASCRPRTATDNSS